MTAQEASLSEFDIADLKRMEQIRRAVDELEEELKFLQSRLVKELPEGASVLIDPESGLRATAVIPKEKLVLDVERLRAVDADLYRLVTETRVSESKVAQARRRGYFRAGAPEMTAVTGTVQARPHVRFTRSTEGESRSA